MLGLLFACGGNNTNTEANTEKDTVVKPVEVQELVIDSDYMLDTSKTVIRWVGSKPTENHIGEVKAIRGALQKAGDVFVDGIIQLNMNTITCEDISDESKNAKLIKHLKGEDFFNVDEFPMVTLHALDMNVGEDGRLSMSSELTIKGITERVESDLSINEYNDTISVIGDLVFDRTLFGIKYKSVSIFPELADKFIKDEVSIEVNAVFVKR